MNDESTRSSRRRGGPGPWTSGFAVLAGLALLGWVACRSGNGPSARGKETLSLADLTPIFGAAEDAHSGLADLTQADRELILSYHLYLDEPAGADLEIARDLAPKIRRLYGHFLGVDRVDFGVSLPNPAGADAWKPYVSFVMTRKLLKETGWSDLLDTDLLSVALEVKRKD